ncbi:MAG: DUF4142 domain-containing protein [Terriglobales bacterium]
MPLILALAVLSLSAWAQQAPITLSPATVSSRLLRVSAANRAMSQLAHIGEKRGATAAVRRYARRVALDHEKVQASLQDKADSLGINLKSLAAATNPLPDQQLEQQLKAVAPTDFDHEFLTAMAVQNRQMIPLLDQGARQPGAGPLQTLMRRIVAIVQIHVTLAEILLKPGAPA